MNLLEQQNKIITDFISNLKELNIKKINIINISKLSENRIILDKSRSNLKIRLEENQIVTNIFDFKIDSSVNICELQNLKNLLVNKDQSLINIIIVQNFIRNNQDINELKNLIEKINKYNCANSNNQIFIKDYTNSELRKLCNSKIGFISSIIAGFEFPPNYPINFAAKYNHEICSYIIKENILDKLKAKEKYEIAEENYILKEILTNIKKQFIASKIVKELIDLNNNIKKRINLMEQNYNVEDEIEKIFNKYFEYSPSEIEEIKQIILLKINNYPFISKDILQEQIIKQKIKYL